VQVQKEGGLCLDTLQTDVLKHQRFRPAFLMGPVVEWLLLIGPARHVPRHRYFLT